MRECSGREEIYVAQTRDWRTQRDGCRVFNNAFAQGTAAVAKVMLEKAVTAVKGSQSNV
jgi:hypothetical protein